MTLRFENINFSLNEEITQNSIAEKIKIKPENIDSWRLHKKGIDARRKNDIHYVCSIDVEIKNEHNAVNLENFCKVEDTEYVFPKSNPLKERPVIIGFGPAGMFAALVLAENGHRPIVIERGENVEERTKKVKTFWETGILNPSSNVQFGEGGAGTFSDGKLTTGIKNVRCRKVLEYFVRFGAPEDILWNAKPHIGTDVLYNVVKNIRKYIISLGGEIHFKSKADKFDVKNSKICAVSVNGEEIEAKNVILAIGHSARDTLRELFNEEIPMQAKPFSVGARIEHKKEMIDASQYGKSALFLPAADYKLSTHIKINGRGVYTFCMCPGGVVVAASSEEKGIAVNGMSYRARNGENSNSALLVGVTPKDFGSNHPLAGIDFQRMIEERAYKFGGNNYFAPSQLVGDFLKRKPSVGKKSITPTYKPGTIWGNLDDILPDFICDSMRYAILEFDKKLNGFACPEAVLTAPETRSSSPVRIERDKETCQSNIKGLYPCGEGAGYAGGIMSSATDGILCAEKMILNSLEN